jgi:predicted MFS family arabinose efflux permease
MTFVLFWTGLVVMVSLYVTIPLISFFSDFFQTSPNEAAWTGSAFSLFFAVGCIFYGPISERFGRKKVIIIGLGALSIISIFIGFVDNLYLLITLRAFHGAAAATFSPVALAYVVEMFPGSRKVTTTGFISAGFLMAGIIGQVYSSWISDKIGWNYVFFILGGVYIFTFFLILLFLPRDPSQPYKPINPLGSIFKNRFLLFSYFIALTVLLSFVGMYSALQVYLGGPKFNLTDETILYIRAIGIIGMLFSPFAGKLIEKFSILYVLRMGLGLATIGLVAIGISSNLTVVIVMSVLFVTGIAITVPTLISLVGQLGGKSRGIAISMYTFILFIGASIGPLISVNLSHSKNSALPFEVLGIIIALAFVITFFIKNKDDNGTI